MGNPWPLPRPSLVGKFFICLALLTAGSGLALANNHLLLCGCLLAALLIACWDRAAVNLAGIAVERRIPFPIHAGATFLLRLTISRPAWPWHARLLILEDIAAGDDKPRQPLRVYISAVAPTESTTAWIPASFSRRGEKTLARLEIKSFYPLGLFGSSRIFERPCRFIVYPRLRKVSPAILPDEERQRWERVAPLRSGPLVEDFAGLRDYRPGDNPKWIVWKSLAQGNGRWRVREFEGAALKRARLVLEAYRPAIGPSGNRHFERAVELTASLASALVNRRFVVHVLIRKEQPQDCTALVISPHDRSLYSFYRFLALLQPAEPCREEIPYSWLPTLRIDPSALDPQRPLPEVLVWRP